MNVTGMELQSKLAALGNQFFREPGLARQRRRAQAGQQRAQQQHEREQQAAEAGAFGNGLQIRCRRQGERRQEAYSGVQ